MNIREKITVVEILSQLDIDLAEELETMDKSEFTAYIVYLIKKYENKDNTRKLEDRGSRPLGSLNRGLERPSRPLSVERQRLTEGQKSRVKEESKPEVVEEVEEVEDVKEVEEIVKDTVSVEEVQDIIEEPLDNGFKKVVELDPDVDSLLEGLMDY